MEVCLSGIKVEDLEFLNILRKKLGQRMKLTLHGSGRLVIEMPGLVIFSHLEDVNLPNSFSRKKTRLPAWEVDEKSSPCSKADGCAVFQMNGFCRKNCKLRG